MEKNFWLKAWNDNRIGFHRQSYHPKLIEHFPREELPKKANILVPLCGKSLDLIWLANQGHHVIGIELSPLASQQFFHENGLNYQEKSSKTGTSFRSEGNLSIQIFNEDFFEFSFKKIETIHFIYDRAAIIALPPIKRKLYFKKLSPIIQQGAKKLLISLEYDQNQIAGPPFSVPEKEIQDYCHEKFQITLLDQEMVTAKNPKFLDCGMKELSQKVYSIHV